MPSELKPALRLCPHCHTEIPDFEMDGVVLSFCLGCKGLWLDKSELSAYLGGTRDLPNLTSSLKLAEPTQLSCARCPDQTLVEIPFALGASLRIDWCPQCAGIWLDAGELEVARKLKAAAASTRPPSVPDLPLDPYEKHSFAPSAWWHVPVMLVFSQVISWVLVGPVLFLLTLQFHEFGHALAAWATGSFAIPLFYGETIAVAPSQRFYYSCLMLALALGILGRREKRPFLILIAAGWAGLQTYCFWALSSSAQEELVVFAGIAGELVVPSLLMTTFFYRLPQYARWDFWRFPVFALAATAFLGATKHWRAVALGKEKLPLGSLLNGRDDGGGDIDRLLTMGWNTFQITDSLTYLAQLCLAVIALHYAWSLAQIWSKDLRKY